MKLRCLIGGIIGVIIGYCLAYLRIPYITENGAFYIGFLFCLAFVCIGYLVLNNKTNKHQLSKDIRHTLTKVAWITLMFLLGGIISYCLLSNRIENLQIQLNNQKSLIDKQSVLLQSDHNRSYTDVMLKLLDDIDEEITSNTQQKLNASTIDQIAELSHAFRPYPYWKNRALSQELYSPQRAQLLLKLLKLELDSTSMAEIINKSSFENADLEGMNLSGLQLKNINLNGANLKYTNLSYSNLLGADLSGCNFFQANLTNTELSQVDLQSANLSSSNLTHANISNSNLNNVILVDAVCRYVQIHNSNLKWADLSGAFLNEANLKESDLLWAKCIRTNFSNSNLENTNLSRAVFNDAILDGSMLDGAKVNSADWLHELKHSNISGSEKINKDYQVVNDSLVVTGLRLRKVSH